MDWTIAENLEFHAQNKQWYAGVELFARAREAPGRVAYAQPVVMETVDIEDAGLIRDPFMVLGRSAAQSLIDELWACGFRPSDGTGSAGQLKATENHLEDMRRITFKFVDDRKEPERS